MHLTSSLIFLAVALIGAHAQDRSNMLIQPLTSSSGDSATSSVPLTPLETPSTSLIQSVQVTKLSNLSSFIIPGDPDACATTPYPPISSLRNPFRAPSSPWTLIHQMNIGPQIDSAPQTTSNTPSPSQAVPPSNPLSSSSFSSLPSLLSHTQFAFALVNSIITHYFGVTKEDVTTAGFFESVESDAESSLAVDPSVIGTNLAQNGLGANGTEAGQAASATSTNNFINFCVGKTITNGMQVQDGSCNSVPMGNIPSRGSLPSCKFTAPKNGDNFAENTAFTITIAISGIQTGAFVNPNTNYFGAPQDLNAMGQIIGHSHVVVQAIKDVTDTAIADPTVFAFFRSLNAAAQDGILTASITSGLPAGTYRLASINTAANFQPVIGPFHNHGSFDDFVYFTVGDAAKAAASPIFPSAFAPGLTPIPMATGTTTGTTFTSATATTSNTPPTSTPSAVSMSSKQQDLGVILGGTIGGGLGLILVLFLLAYSVRRQRRYQNSQNLLDPNEDKPWSAFRRSVQQIQKMVKGTKLAVTPFRFPMSHSRLRRIDTHGSEDHSPAGPPLSTQGTRPAGHNRNGDPLLPSDIELMVLQSQGNDAKNQVVDDNIHAPSDNDRDRGRAMSPATLPIFGRDENSFPQEIEDRITARVLAMLRVQDASQQDRRVPWASHTLRPGYEAEVTHRDRQTNSLRSDSIVPPSEVPPLYEE